MLFTIKDIENLSGIKAHTIRIWEQRYTFLKPSRTGTNIRYYSNDELKTILNIALLNKYGYKISHISKMGREVMFQKVLSLTDHRAQANIVVNRLIESMANYDSEEFEKRLNEYIQAHQTEQTILDIIYPFLDKVGILWQTNHIHPVQERLVSNVIRQKIIVGIDAMPTQQTSLPKVCLFLPEGEYHEISLLFVALLLKKKGVPVIYLGANIPFDELTVAVKMKNPDYLYTHITTAGPAFNFEKFLFTLHEEFRPYPVVISGLLTQSYAKKIPQKITFKKSLAEVREFISAL